MDATARSSTSIDPEKARSALGPPRGCEAFAALAGACDRGVNDLERQAGPPAPPEDPRLFSIWEITRYMMPMAVGHFRRVLKANPDLPQGRSDTAAGAKWFTLAEVHRLRRHFAAEGSRARSYRPYRPAGLPAKIATVANALAGVGKTTTVLSLATAAVLDGYRVLAVDLDPQARLTRALGGGARDEWQTAFALLAGHYAQFQQAENQRRIDRGDPPVPLDETLGAAARIEARDLIRPTGWPGLDLIGADLSLCRSEVQLPLWRLQGRGWRLWDGLRARLQATGALDNYDVILIDTAPGLGQLALVGLAAADLVLVPTQASRPALAGTGRFLDMLGTTFRSIEAEQNMTARALGQTERRFAWDGVRSLITRYDPVGQAETATLMQAALGPALSPHRQETTALLAPGAGSVRGIYGIDYREVGRERYVQARRSFDAVYGAFKTLLVGAWRRDEIAAAGGDPQGGDVDASRRVQ